MPEPPTKAASRGGEAHRQIEHYLTTGEDVLGEVARAAKEFMPRPMAEGHLVEHRFDGELTADGVPLVGYIDLVSLDSNFPWVTDWKTTGDLKRALKSGELIRTIQMPGYAKWALTKCPDAIGAGARHVYMSTKGVPDARVVEATWCRTTVDERWGEVEELVRIGMRPVAKAALVEDVTPNYDACNAFGGCAYRAQCPRDHSVVIRNLFGGGDSMGLKDKLMQQSRTAVEQTKANLVAQEKAVKVGMMTGVVAEKAFGEKLPMGAGLLGVLPPDAPKSGETGPKAEAFTAEEAKQVAPELLTRVGAEVLPEPEKKKRGRPRSNKPVEEQVKDLEESLKDLKVIEDQEAAAIKPFAKTKVIRRIGLANYSYLEFEAEATTKAEYEDALTRMGEFGWVQ